MSKTSQTALRRWLKAQPRGSMNDIAKKLGVSRQYIYKIAEGDQVISYARAIELSELTGINVKNFSYYRVHERES